MKYPGLFLGPVAEVVDLLDGAGYEGHADCLRELLEELRVQVGALDPDGSCPWCGTPRGMSDQPHPDGGVEVILEPEDLLPQNEAATVKFLLHPEAMMLAMQDSAWPSVKSEPQAHVFVARFYKQAKPKVLERIRKARDRARIEAARRMDT